MRSALKVVAVLIAVIASSIAGLSGWVALVRPEILQLATAYAAKVVCSNVFIAKRDIASIVQDDLLALGQPIFKYMKIDVNATDQRVQASLFGLFPKKSAEYVEGRGCTIVADSKTWNKLPPLPAPPTTENDDLWPAGEKVLLSENERLRAALKDPKLQGPGMRAIVVVHDGRIVAETYGQGFTPSTPLLGWSMTKGVTAALIGMAIKDGKLSVDQKKLFQHWAEDARAEISIADLLAMSVGLEWNEDADAINDPAKMEFLVKDAAAFARDRRSIASPGTKFYYSSAASVLLTRLWQNAVGELASSYPRERLFKPLGMNNAVLEADETGTFLGEAFLYATAHDWARFAEFLRLGGKWNGQQLLPAGFVDYMRTPLPTSDEGHGPVYGRGQVWLARGLGFNLPADTFMLLGHNHQAIAIIPSRKLVIVRMGSTREDVGYSVASLLHAIAAADL